MKTSEICIIHLSDLHFEKGKYSTVYNDLLDDIKNQVLDEEQIIIVATGDFATKGKVSQSEMEIVEFFARLLEIMPEGAKILDVEIVPGNHDVSRPKMSNNYNSETHFPISTEFESLRDKIYDVFKDKGVVSKSTAGVNCVSHNEQDIAFVRLDTSAFSTVDEWYDEIKDDYIKNGKMVANDNDGRVLDEVKNRKEAFKAHALKQQSDINEAYKQVVRGLKKKKPDITFAISHHPLTLLNTTGFDDLADILFKRGLYFIDAIICGHKHKAQLSYTLDNAQQRMMLMSGVGWQESQETVMRYSLYRISLERNICQVSVRMAKEGRRFSFDTNVGDSDDKEFSRTKQYMLPLKANRVGCAITLTAKKNEMAKGLYVDQETLNMAPRILRVIVGFGKRMDSLIARIYDDVCGKWDKHETKDLRTDVSFSNLSRSKRRKLLRIIDKGKIISSFWDGMCEELARALCEIESDMETEYPDGSHPIKSRPEWRVHYRVYRNLNQKEIKENKDFYVARTSKGVEGGVLKDLPCPRDISWGGLVKGAFDTPRHMMINSAVPGLNENIGTIWSDFMTICPHFKGSELTLTYKGGQTKRPIITFGISYKVQEFEALKQASRILYWLEYVDINYVLEVIANDFIGKFGLKQNDLINLLAEKGFIARCFAF